MTRGRALACVLAVLVAGATAGCAGGRNTLGTGASECFRGLPAARTAAHNKGKLVGVRRVSATALRARMHSTATLSTPDKDLCVFAFSGTFAPGSVDGAHNTQPGRFALVAVGDKHPSEVAAFVLDHLPTRFRHLR